MLYTAVPFLVNRIDRAWAKLNKYYNLTDTSIAYVAATALNSTLKWRFFERHWNEEHLIQMLQTSKNRVRELWIDCYAAKAELTAQSSNILLDLDDFDAFMVQDYNDDVPNDELNLFFQEANLTFTNADQKARFRALNWWLEPTQRQRYSRLSKMAFDLLTVPAMSAEAERIFSECSLALNDQRQRISPETLEELMLLRSWLRNAEKTKGQMVDYFSYINTILKSF